MNISSLPTRSAPEGRQLSSEEMVRGLTAQADRIAAMHPRLSFKALFQLLRSTFTTSTRPDRIAF